MVSLEEQLNNPYDPYQRVCKFGPWVATLNEDDQASVWRALENHEITLRHTHRTLKAIGCPSAESAIRSHRHHECDYCERTFHGKHV